MNRVEFTELQTSYRQRILENSPKLFKLLFTAPKLLFKTFNYKKFGTSSFNFQMIIYLSAFLNFQKQFDVVHAHFGFNSKIYFLYQKLGLFQNAKLVTSFHGTGMRISEIEKNKKRYRTLFDNNITLTTNNNYGKEIIQSIRPGYKNIKLLPVGLDTTYFIPSSVQEKNEIFKIVFCGRLVPIKGPDLVVEIARILINDRNLRKLKFLLLGDGKLRQNI